MKKPKPEICSEYFDDAILDAVERLRSKLSNAQREELECLITYVYKSGYIDGIIDIFWFIGKYD